jgi:phage terminase small subunit
MSLTPKQEKFCQCIVSGMSGKDSYLTAYNCDSDNAAMVESTKLLKRDDINERLKELRKPIENLVATQAITEREKKKAIIWERIQACIENNDDTSVARYMDILNKMDSEYININRNITDNNENISDLDTDKLLRLVTTA